MAFIPKVAKFALGTGAFGAAGFAAKDLLFKKKKKEQDSLVNHGSQSPFQPTTGKSDSTPTSLLSTKG